MIADLAMQRAIDRYQRVGVAGLADAEKTLATIWYVESKVANGGFEHFYKAAEGELASGAPAALRAVGAEELAGIVERANALFGPDGVPSGREDRTKFLQTMPDSARKTLDALEAQYMECAPDLDVFIEAYLTRQSKGAD